MFFPLVRIVLIFCIAGLLFFVLRARRTLGAYRIPRRPAFSSHLVSRVTGHASQGRYGVYLFAGGTRRFSSSVQWRTMLNSLELAGASFSLIMRKCWPSGATS